MKSSVQSFDVRLGYPNSRLGLQFSDLTRRWNVHEPYRLAMADLDKQEGGAA